MWPIACVTDVTGEGWDGMAERKQSVQIVREGEEVTIEFQSGGWKATTVTIDSFNGIASVTALQDGIRVHTQLVNLRRD